MLVAIACFLVSTRVQAQGSVAQQATPWCAAASPQICYARTLIASLLTAHRSLHEPDTTGASNDPLRLAQAVMYASKRHQTGLSRAQEELEPFTTSPDSLVRASAAATILGLKALAGFYSASMEQLKQDLDGEGSEGLGTRADRLAALQVQRRDGAEMLALGAVSATYTMLRPFREPERVSLAISEQERRTLLAEIEKSFGAALTPRSGGRHGSDYATAAVILRKFLAQQWSQPPEHRSASPEGSLETGRATAADAIAEKMNRLSVPSKDVALKSGAAAPTVQPLAPSAHHLSSTPAGDPSLRISHSEPNGRRFLLPDNPAMSHPAERPQDEGALRRLAFPQPKDHAHAGLSNARGRATPIEPPYPGLVARDALRRWRP